MEHFILTLILYDMFTNSENKEKIELYLSMGATRWEACRPVAVEAMRRAMLPTINQMRYAMRYNINMI